VTWSDDVDPRAVPAQGSVARTHCPECSTPLDPPVLRPGEASDLGYAQVLQQRCTGCNWLHVHVRWLT
jgi:RNase P subunit RPR2